MLLPVPVIEKHELRVNLYNYKRPGNFLPFLTEAFNLCISVCIIVERSFGNVKVVIHVLSIIESVPLFQYRRDS